MRRLLRWLQDALRRNATWRHRALAAEADLARVRTELALVRGVSAALDQEVAALGDRAETRRRALSGGGQR